MTLITLMTDFGSADGNVGVMKGVIWRIAPEVKIADLSHEIAPQNIRQAAWVLDRVAPYFPDGTIHVVVVDPGVGTARRPIAARIGPMYFVGPDNGLITPLIELAERAGWNVRIVHLNQPQNWLPEVSSLFHGRDIFAPIAAHLANGMPLEVLGSPISDPVLLPMPRPERTEAGWQGLVTYIDHFGNIATNIHRKHLEGMEVATAHLGNTEIRGMVHTFGERAPGDLIALYSSTGFLIVAVVNGNAAERLGMKVGDSVEVVVQTIRLHD